METKEHYLSIFEKNKTALNAGPDWLIASRSKAIESFNRNGFPTRREEHWRHTNFSPLTRQNFYLAEPKQFKVSQKEIDSVSIANLDAYRIVFINGFFSRELSSLDNVPAGVRIAPLAEVLANEPALAKSLFNRIEDAQDNAFTALNSAFVQDGAFVSISDGVVPEKPVHLLFYSASRETPTVSHPRSVIIAGKNSQVQIVESYAGEAGRVYWTNARTDISVGENASVEHCRLQRESLDAFHISTNQVDLARDSRYNRHCLSLGGGLVRNDVTVSLNDEGIDCNLNGLYMLDGERHCDNHTLIVHEKPYCQSHELYKGILDGRSSGVFQGKIFVAKNAQKTDSKQTNQSLLLSDEAEVDAMPQLEIYADDVKCTHGSTTGQLDEDAVFYLRARGIDKEAARGLLTYAFASDVIQRIRIDAVREELDAYLHRQLPI